MARRTCAELLTRRRDDLPVHVDPKAADGVRSAMDAEAVRAFGASLAQDFNLTAMRCEFASPACEATWIVLTHAVDFGSGWRQALHRHHGKGAWLTIKPGVEALYRLAVADNATDLPSVWLQGLTKDRIATAFGISNNAELDLLAEYLLVVLHDLGQGSKEFGSLQTLVTQTLKDISASTTPAGDFVWMLVDRFPTTFNDRYTLDFASQQQQVCFFKKGQLVTGELYHRFRDENKDFRFADGDALTAFIDNVIVASMRHQKVIVPDKALTKAIESGQDIPMGSLEEVTLRAAAMCGVDAIVQGTPLSSCELGNWLWGGYGKLPEVRKFARHATKTIFY